MILKREVTDEEIGGLSFDCGESGIAMSESHSHGCHPSAPEDVPGGAKTLTAKAVDAGAAMLQSLEPIKAFQQHVCTWAIFSHDMNRKIQTHHHAARLNDDFLQCAVYDSDQSNARLIGVEYVVSENVFKDLPPEEKKLWHSHEFEIREGLWVNPGVPETVEKQEVKGLAHTYGKFWCTWQFDRGDVLPMGMPALMMSPQAEEPGRIPNDSVDKRDAMYGISSSSRKHNRADIPRMTLDPNSDRWRATGKGFEVDLKEVVMSMG